MNAIIYYTKTTDEPIGIAEASKYSVEITTPELDYANRIDMMDGYFSDVKQITLDENFLGWPSTTKGFGEETIVPMPESGMLFLRQLTVDAKRSIVVFTKGESDTTWLGRTAWPTDVTTAGMIPTYSINVNKGDNVLVLTVNATAASKTSLYAAYLMPYKKVTLVGIPS